MTAYERESKDFQGVWIRNTRTGELITENVEIAMLRPTATVPRPRPAEEDWKPAEILSGETGLLIEPQEAPGELRFFIRVTANPEEPVRYAGSIQKR